MTTESLERRAMLAVSVVPNVETDNTSSADDAAIWIHPTDPAQSTIIGAIKNSSSSLRVYDLTGNELQSVGTSNINNVDLRYNFSLSGQATTLVIGSKRSNDSIAIYKVDPQTRMLQDIAAQTISTGMDIYGAAMYVSPVSGKYYAFVTSESGQVQQWELFDNGSGAVDATQVRSFSVGSKTEGIVADDVHGWLYAGEENVGIWKYSAEPGGGTGRTQVDSTGSGGNLDADVEGLTIYYETGGTGYLLASSQGNDEFAVYRREGSNEYLGNFELVAGGGIDAVSDTDGIDVTNAPLGSQFPQGMFVAQDNDVNFKLTRWDAINSAFGGLLSVDTSWDPRSVGVPPSSDVEGRQVFYNNSAFDGNDSAINTSDDSAIDPVRSAYLPGSGAATDANITGYDKGLNGIMVDLTAGVDHTSITAADFVFKVGNNNSPDSWSAAPAPSDVQVRTGAGVSGADRVVITWADNAIEKEWLEVQVLANANTGLLDTFGGGIGDVFFFGNAVGDGDTGNSPTGAPVNATDEIGARNNPHNFLNPATVDDQYDYNKDTFVNATDQLISRNNGTNFLTQLTKINIGTGGPFAPVGDEDSGDASGGALDRGDTGIASALAAAEGDDSAAIPAVAASGGNVAPSAGATGRAVAGDAGLLLEVDAALEQIDLGSADDALENGLEGGLDDALLDALAASLI